MKRKYLIRTAYALAAIILVMAVGAVSFRGALLRSVADGKIEALSQKSGLRVEYARLSMPSLSSIRMDGLSVVPIGCDTLLTLGRLEVKLALFPLLCGDVSIRGVEADEMRLTFIKKDSTSNFDFLFRAKTHGETVGTSRTRSGYGERLGRALDMLFGLLPQNALLRNLTVTASRDSVRTCFAVPELRIQNSRFETDVRVEEDNLHNEWRVQGVLDREDRTLESRIASLHRGGRVVLPYIRSHYQAFVGFDTVAFRLNRQTDGSVQTLDGSASVKGLEVYHAGLSPDTIGLNQAELDYTIHVGGNYMELDSLSTVVFNQLNFHPYLRAQKESRWHVTASVRRKPFPAQELFSSLPAGLFTHLQGIQVDGQLSYDFLLDADFNCLDSLKFHSDLVGHDFRIRRMGSSDLTKMNGDFEYTAYDGDVPVRTFIIGPANPSFRTLGQISPLLQTAIMQSEDGHFYFHQGFYPGAIQEALIYDLKERRFARGGSSITMQLVKNVFLNKRKNIARKLEEALIVWLIEDRRLTSKDRMYEVYLNIAEWGPGIYGAAEASHFYFSKEPSELTLQEAIFMASVIPRPKHFYWSFNPDGTLRESQEGYFRQIARRLSVKGLITEEQAENFVPEVDVTGSARSLIVKSDTLLAVPTDSI